MTGAVPKFVTVSATPPAPAVEVARNTSVGGLKKVIMLEVKDVAETVTTSEYCERPGTPKGPRLTHVSSPVVEQSALVVHAFRVVQSMPRTT